jgi:dipeptidyl-peptidase III
MTPLRSLRSRQQISPLQRLLQLHNHTRRTLSTVATANPPVVVANMDAQTRKHYLADSPPSVVRLEIKPHFEALKDESLKRYAHFMSR